MCVNFDLQISQNPMQAEKWQFTTSTISASTKTMAQITSNSDMRLLSEPVKWSTTLLITAEISLISQYFQGPSKTDWRPLGPFCCLGMGEWPEGLWFPGWCPAHVVLEPPFWLIMQVYDTIYAANSLHQSEYRHKIGPSTLATFNETEE